MWAAVGGSGGAARATMIVYCSNGGAASIGIQYDGTVLSTAGPQNTPAEFFDFLDWYPDIPTPTATFSFGGIRGRVRRP